MTINAFLNGLEAAAPLETAKSVLTALAFRRGGDAVFQNDDTPRIVWVPLRAQQGEFTRPGGTPRRILVRAVSVAAHIWGEDLDQTERLLETVIQALQVVAPGAFRMVSEDWPTQDVTAANARRGELAVLVFEVDVPVFDGPHFTEPTTTTATVTAVELAKSEGDPGDGKLDHGEDDT